MSEHEGPIKDPQETQQPVGNEQVIKIETMRRWGIKASALALTGVLAVGSALGAYTADRLSGDGEPLPEGSEIERRYDHALTPEIIGRLSERVLAKPDIAELLVEPSELAGIAGAAYQQYSVEGSQEVLARKIPNVLNEGIQRLNPFSEDTEERWKPIETTTVEGKGIGIAVVERSQVSIDVSKETMPTISTGDFTEEVAPSEDIEDEDVNVLTITVSEAELLGHFLHSNTLETVEMERNWRRQIDNALHEDTLPDTLALMRDVDDRAQELLLEDENELLSAAICDAVNTVTYANTPVLEMFQEEYDERFEIRTEVPGLIMKTFPAIKTADLAPYAHGPEPSNGRPERVSSTYCEEMEKDLETATITSLIEREDADNEGIMDVLRSKFSSTSDETIVLGDKHVDLGTERVYIGESRG